MRHLQGLMVFFNTKGFDGPRLFTQAGLDPAQLENGDSRVSLAVAEALLAAFQAQHPDPFVGLKAAEDVQPSTLGALGFLLQSCATLADLLEVSVRFNGLMTNFGFTSIHQVPGGCEIRYDCLAGSPAFVRQTREHIIGLIYTIDWMLLPGAPSPLAVCFSHACPAVPGAAKVYADFFHCPVYFDQAHTAITVPVGMLQMRLPHANAELKPLLEAHTRSVFERLVAPAPSLAQEVGRLLKTLVPTGEATKQTVARRLGMSTRTLHRKLEDEGTSYSELQNAVKLERARAELATGDIAIAELSDRLNFNSPQAFMRWFKQRCGVTPGQFRRERDTS
jgi:AraC-like DNA-binding protein